MSRPWIVSLTRAAQRPAVTLGLVRAHQVPLKARGFWGGDDPWAGSRSCPPRPDLSRVLSLTPDCSCLFMFWALVQPTKSAAMATATQRWVW